MISSWLHTTVTPTSGKHRLLNKKNNQTKKKCYCPEVTVRAQDYHHLQIYEHGTKENQLCIKSTSLNLKATM